MTTTETPTKTFPPMKRTELVAILDALWRESNGAAQNIVRLVGEVFRLRERNARLKSGLVVAEMDLARSDETSFAIREELDALRKENERLKAPLFVADAGPVPASAFHYCSREEADALADAVEMSLEELKTWGTRALPWVRRLTEAAEAVLKSKGGT